VYEVLTWVELSLLSECLSEICMFVLSEIKAHAVFIDFSAVSVLIDTPLCILLICKMSSSHGLHFRGVHFILVLDCAHCD